MVQLTLEMLLRGFANHNQPLDAEHLRKMTHLQIAGRDIEWVDPEALNACRGLTVAYLYDNRLENVPAFRLPSSSNLTHLYLQNNAISRITGLEPLKSLLKLFLGGNQLTVVEGLEHCTQLEELRLERQHLPPGHRLVFDPQTVAGISQSLQTLEISGNKIGSLVPIAPLVNLRELIATTNLVEDFREVGALLENSWHRLEILDLSGNAICSHNKYRERVIYLGSSMLRQLDGKEITDAQRRFVLGWHQAASGKTKASGKLRNATQSNISSWQASTPGTQLHSETTALRMHADPLLNSHSVIPAMPLRNTIKHQAPKHPVGGKPKNAGGNMLNTFSAFSAPIPQKSSNTGVDELSRRLQQNDINPSLSATG